VRLHTNAGFLGENAFLVQSDFRDFARENNFEVRANFNIYLYDGPHSEQVTAVEHI